MDKTKEFTEKLKLLNINAESIDYKEIDSFFYYDLRLLSDTKINHISANLQEIACSIKSPVPTIKVIPEKGVIRLVFPKSKNKTIKLFDIFSNRNVPKGNLICLLGQSATGEKIWMNLEDNPNMIVAGTSGSGKTILLHNIIANIINYNDAILYLVDPKNMEFSKYQSLKRSKVKVAFSYDEAINMMNSLISIMEQRYVMMANGTNSSEFKNIVVIVDEFADLIMQDKSKDLYNKVCILAQKCRAAKINMILATQRPSVNVINGNIKANFPARIACRTVSKIDSRIILDEKGAESLAGKGDALIKSSLYNMERFQVAYTDPDEVVRMFN